MQTFRHAGKSGDLIFGLPVIKRLGGGRLIIHPSPDIHMPIPSFSREMFENIRPLLLMQPYIDDVVYSEKLSPKADYDLNLFRLHWDGKYNDYYASVGWEAPINITQMHLAAFNLKSLDASIKSFDVDAPWLILPGARQLKHKVIISRSQRYHSKNFPWKSLVERHRDHAQFIGTDSEHADFTAEFGHADRLLCHDLLEVACAINSCEQFIGNQSCPNAIAEGLKIPLIQECWGHDSNCMFHDRDGADYILDGPMVSPTQYTPL